jgi:predicted alpha/beta hydrolase
MIDSREVEIRASDGYTLSGTLYQGPSPQGRSVLISSAMAVPKKFYRHFAQHLAGLGFTVLAYDYRGIGDSAPENLRGFPAGMRDWGEKDMSGAVDWLLEAFPEQSVALVGHSAGGQLAGFLPQPERALKLALICSGSAYWNLFPFPLKAKLVMLYYFLLPVLTAILGHGPGRLLRSGEDVPPGVMKEWLHWSRREGYITGEPGNQEIYSRFQIPLRAYGVEDDAWATPNSVKALLQGYSGTETEFILVTRKLGHFRYFRPGNEDLWQECADWLLA